MYLICRSFLFVKFLLAFLWLEATFFNVLLYCKQRLRNCFLKTNNIIAKKTNVCLMLMFLLWIIIGIRLFINMTFPQGYNLYLLSKESQFKTSGSFLLLFMKFEKKKHQQFFLNFMTINKINTWFLKWDIFKETWFY